MTTEEISIIKDYAVRGTATATVTETIRLCEEIERLRQGIKEAKALIGHFGWTSAEHVAVIAKAGLWLNEYFPTPTCQQREDGGNNTPDSKRPR